MSSSSRPPTTRATATTADKVPSRSNIKVLVNNYAYHPGTLTVAAGARVTFSNHDQTSHTATSTGMGFDTGTVPPGHSATILLTKAGTYTYYCQFHAFMRGTILVK